MSEEQATFGAGCFWGVEYVFRRVPGVLDVAVGYSGGMTKDPTYEDVCSHTTGHAEVAQVTFDPETVTYDQLLEVFWAMHDPTQVNRQGPDVGPSYRSAIFPQTAAQRAVAQKFLAQLRASGKFKRPIATKIETGTFYRAEASHQDFMRRNPLHPYIVIHDRPKVANLKSTYPQLWKA